MTLPEDSQLLTNCNDCPGQALRWLCDMQTEKGFCIKRGQLCYRIGFQSFWGWDAVMEFFGLTYNQAIFLFNTVRYRIDMRDKKVVMHRVSSIVAAHEVGLLDQWMFDYKVNPANGNDFRLVN